MGDRSASRVAAAVRHIPPIVHAITDHAVLTRQNFMEHAVAVMAALGSRGAVHLRSDRLSASALFELARELRGYQDESGCWVVINDRVDVALAAGARAAQLGGHSMGAADARRVAPALGIGVSVHDQGEGVRAAAAGADWLLFGNVFETASHPGRKGRGPTAAAGVIRACGIPVMAIGGVLPESVPLLRQAGFAGVATIRGIWHAARPGSAAASYLSAYGAD